MRKKLDVTEMWFLRRMTGISWKEKKAHNATLDILGVIYRYNGLKHSALTGKIEGTRSRGRQRITYFGKFESLDDKQKAEN